MKVEKGLQQQMCVTYRRELQIQKIASDHYHHLSEDIELMADLGIDLYRFRSIGHVSWVMVISRIKKASIFIIV